MKAASAWVVLALALAPACLAQEDLREVRSRSLAASFQQELGQRLMSALSEQGPAEAITVCRDAAPAIAARLSAESGARVSRTALRTRNPANVADAAARATMESFAAQMQAGENPAELEQFNTYADGRARYMKAIATLPQCLLCHGSNIDPAIRSAISANYPQDTATGFEAGELRGAFLVDWPGKP